MIRTLFIWLLLVGTAVAVAACCGSVSCNCQEGSADALVLRFNVNPARGGFQPEQVDSVYVRRTPFPVSTALKPDSVLLVRPTAQTGQPIILNNTTPLPANGTRKLHQYTYVLRLASKVKPPLKLRSFRLDSVQVVGRFEADGCCTCYRNTQKSLRLDKRTYDQTVAGRDTVVLSR